MCNVGTTLATAERDLICRTLDHCHGSRVLAAETLGISLRTLQRKIRDYGWRRTRRVVRIRREAD